MKDEITIFDIALLCWYQNVKNPFVKPGHFEYRYDINADDRIDILMTRGYLIEVNPNTQLKRLKFDELKSILKKNNLMIGSKKSDFIDRIKSNISKTFCLVCS